MTAVRKRSWPNQPGLWWMRDITVYAPGSHWAGRVVKRTHIARWDWRVVKVMEVTKDRVQIEDLGRSLHPSYFIRRPSSYHRQQWVPAIPPS